MKKTPFLVFLQYIIKLLSTLPRSLEITGHMKIHPDNFRWYAAFHDESHHPHVHMLCWSTNPKEGYVTERGIEKIKSGLARHIFRDDLSLIYEQQTDRRQELSTKSLEVLREMCGKMKSGSLNNPHIDHLLLQLSQQFSDARGKKVYGFLKPEVKSIVDSIMEELAKDERVAACYSAWYEMREEVCNRQTPLVVSSINYW